MSQQKLISANDLLAAKAHIKKIQANDEFTLQGGNPSPLVRLIDEGKFPTLITKCKQFFHHAQQNHMNDAQTQKALEALVVVCAFIKDNEKIESNIRYQANDLRENVGNELKAIALLSSEMQSVAATDMGIKDKKSPQYIQAAAIQLYQSINKMFGKKKSWGIAHQYQGETLIAAANKHLSQPDGYINPAELGAGIAQYLETLKNNHATLRDITSADPNNPERLARIHDFLKTHEIAIKSHVTRSNRVDFDAAKLGDIRQWFTEEIYSKIPAEIRIVPTPSRIPLPSESFVDGAQNQRGNFPHRS